jgi:hypothetical protein
VLAGNAAIARYDCAPLLDVAFLAENTATFR